MHRDVLDSTVTPKGASAKQGSARPEQSAADRPFLNRELQWLEFNARVLHQATESDTPLLERVRFLSIFSSNLDEFFMKRVGGLRRQLAAGLSPTGPDDIGPEELLEMIRERVIPMTQRKAECYRKTLVPELRRAGIHLLSYSKLSRTEQAEVRSWYRTNVFPLLTPLAVDPGHRFPFISNLSVSLGVMLRKPDDAEPLFARVKIPEVVEQWHQVGAELRFVPLIEIIEHNLQDLFPGMEILEVMAFRVTRNADIEGDHEDADDLLYEIQQQLRDRRFAPVVRMQIGTKPSKRVLMFLSSAMDIQPRDIYETVGLIDYRSLDAIANLPRATLRYPIWTPTPPPRLVGSEHDIFHVIRQGDLLVHHPYESFHGSVERFIREAAVDPAVLGIKQALYRTSGDSPFIHELIRAAEAGKQVAVLVEVRARFDEARNIHWARKLEESGVHVTYGVVGLKTHTKITLVVRQESDGLRSYAHIGTGNYHSRTAKLYEDVGLLTCRRAFTEDIVNLFNYITGRAQKQKYKKLLVAPHDMKQRFLELIEHEVELQRAGGQGRIVAKMNQLQDRAIIGALYHASQQGVKIDLVVRGFCTLRPGVPQLSENIRVVSIVGRFLEHSRIFYFGSGKKNPLDGQFFIGSADWMYRNLHNRVEAICPVEKTPLKARLWRILTVCLADRRQAWEMQPDGGYELRSTEGVIGEPAIGTHQVLMDDARRALENVDPGSDSEEFNAVLDW